MHLLTTHAHAHAHACAHLVCTALHCTVVIFKGSNCNGAGSASFQHNNMLILHDHVHKSFSTQAPWGSYKARLHGSSVSATLRGSAITTTFIFGLPSKDAVQPESKHKNGLRIHNMKRFPCTKCVLIPDALWTTRTESSCHAVQSYSKFCLTCHPVPSCAKLCHAIIMYAVRVFRQQDLCVMVRRIVI